MSTPTTRPHTTVNFKNQPIFLPGGLRCSQIKEGGTAGKYFLDQFPPEIFPRGSILLHDVTHYGIVLEPEQVDLGPTTVSITFKNQHFADVFRRVLKDAKDGRCGAKAIYGAICRTLRNGVTNITSKTND